MNGGTAYLKELMDRAGISGSELANFAGTSAGYISLLTNENITDPGRDKVISIGVFLCETLTELDKLLSLYNVARIENIDTSYFVQNARKIKIKGIQSFKLIGARTNMHLVALENIDGPINLVERFPHIAGQNTEHYASRSDYHGLVSQGELSFYRKLRESLHTERVDLFEKTLKEHEIKCLICKHCFKQYIKKIGNGNPLIPNEPDQIKAHIKNTIELLKKYPNYKISIIDECPPFRFELKIATQSKETDKLIFAGSIDHSYQSSPEEGKKIEDYFKLMGFATDDKKLVSQFKFEFNRLERFIDKKVSESPDSLVKFIVACFEEHHLDVPKEISLE